MTTKPVIKSRVKVTYAGTTYTLYCTNKVRRIRMQDSPPHVPTSGIQSVLTRPYHAVVSVKDIRDAFSHQVELRFDEHGGVIDHLASSTLDTRWGPLWLAPAENNPSNPTDAGSSIWVAPHPGTSVLRPSVVTTPSRNPKAAVSFRGTTNSGVFTWRMDDVAANNYDLDVVRWSGTAWGEEATITAGSTAEDLGGLDMKVHKGRLFFLVAPGGGTGATYVSTNGDTFAATANGPAVGGGTQSLTAGSRLYSDGNTLYAFMQDLTSTGAFDVSSTADVGATAWTSRATNITGILRDLDDFFHPDGTAVPVLLTEQDLLWYDTTNHVVEVLLPLPYLGRACIPFRVSINNAAPVNALLVFMDAQRVYVYFKDGGSADITPGGSQGVPSGFDFGTDASGQVCVTKSAWGVYALWSGLDRAGAAQKPLCLFFDGSIEIQDGLVVSAGWHYIWQKADTSISNAARFIALDPISGDLLMGIQDAASQDTTLVQLKDIEVNPESQGTLDRKTSGAITLPRLDFGSPIVPTTIWDCFLHTNGLDANETIAVAYRVDGSTGAYTTVATVAADNTRITFPANAATDAGLNFRDVQLQFTFSANAVTDNMKAFSFDVGYTRIWPVRYVYILDALFEEGLPADAVPPEVMETNIETLQAATVKMQLLYGNLTTAKMVFPIPSGEEILEILQSENMPSTPRTGTARLVLLEA